MNITEEDVEESLHYLIENAQEYSRARAEAKSMETLLKAREAEAFIEAEGRSAEERKMRARASEKYRSLVDKYKEVLYNAELCETLMNAHKTRISVWQSSSKANHRSM